MFKLLNKISLKYRLILVVASLATVVQVVCLLLFSRVTASFIQVLADETTTALKFKAFSIPVADREQAIIYLSIILAALASIGTIFSLISIYLTSYSSNSIIRELRMLVYRKIYKLPMQDIKKITLGSIMTRVTSDVFLMGLVVQAITRVIINAPITIIFSTVIAVILAPNMSWFIAVLIPLMLLLIFAIIAIAFPYIKKRQKIIDDINNESRENVIGARVIKSYNLEKNQYVKYETISQRFAILSIKMSNVFFLVIPISFLIINIIIAGLFLWGGREIISGSIKPEFVEHLIAYIDFIVYIAFALLQFAGIMGILARGLVSSKRINEIIDYKETFSDIVSDVKINNPSIKFNNVWYSFDEKAQKENDYVLKGINFEVSAYTSLGIIGKSGVGKSVLANILVRNYVVNKGEVLFDNKNINIIDTQNLKENIAITYQDANVFSGTIKENIIFANPKATKEMIIKACETAQAYNYIMKFNNQFEHKIYQGGKNISGGQKQRLSIARSLLKESSIQIFDDSTSALDGLTEKKVINNILKNYKSTKIIISQKISCIKHCDQIVVMEDGKIIERGTHNELLKLQGAYYAIALQQQGEVNE
ncbi:ABC transporter ATP-binding protein [Mycoplasma phocimorsus]|uniref:ABC transporter ATP-binding protein n=1 Tax=Mycoplasma phocimorsus TaxID=3045839 RepID=UPI0024BF56CC|nr:ABC transporter ATP-binding protein [Mycoplasma phocimorsus]MDJ1646831.1 ABC transporter ATP-binding protein [Mycoplasma phocimorsus]